ISLQMSRPPLNLFFFSLLLSVAFSTSEGVSESGKDIKSGSKSENRGDKVAQKEEDLAKPCAEVVDGKRRCIEIGFLESACTSPIITQSDITCPSESHPTIFLLPSNPKESYLPAKFMICMAGGRWMISGSNGSFMDDTGRSAPIHVVCFPKLPEVDSE
ncbi:hypothetical protein PFISCL1PPCAC_20129, partial [Pristionchus fissidentatus]